MKNILSVSIFTCVSLALVLAIILFTADLQRQNQVDPANIVQETAEDQNTDEENDEFIEDEEVIEEEMVEYTLYSNSELDFEFEYPAAWGDIEGNIKDVNHVAQLPGSDWRKEAILTVNGHAFLFSHTDGDVMGRGGFWGDRVSAIEDEAHFSTFCDGWNPADTVLPDETCEVRTNASGINYVHLSGDMWDWEDYTDTNLYFFFDSSAEYKRVAISDIKMTGNVDGALEGIQHVIDTFKFID